MKNDLITTTDDAQTRQALLVHDIDAAVRAFWEKLEAPEEHKAKAVIELQSGQRDGTIINYSDTLSALGKVAGSVIACTPADDCADYLCEFVAETIKVCGDSLPERAVLQIKIEQTEPGTNLIH